MTASDGGERLFTSASARRSALARVAGLVAALVALTALLRLAVPQVTDPAWVRATVGSVGPLAPLAFVALQTVQVILAPVPGQLLAGVGGYLFGTLRGTAYSMLGVLLGSIVVFLAARRFGRPYVERVLTAEAVAHWDRVGVPGLFALFLFPTFPDDLLCAVAGCTDVRLRTFLALVLVGRTPSFLAAAAAGGQLFAGRVGLVAAGLALLALLTAGVYAVRERLVDGLARLG